MLLLLLLLLVAALVLLLLRLLILGLLPSLQILAGLGHQQPCHLQQLPLER